MPAPDSTRVELMTAVVRGVTMVAMIGATMLGDCG